MIELIQVHEPTERQLADYDNRMVTDYEKESKPIIPTVNVNRLERLQEGKDAPEPLPWSQRFFRFFGRR